MSGHWSPLACGIWQSDLRGRSEDCVARPVAPDRQAQLTPRGPMRRRTRPRQARPVLRVVLALVTTFVFVTGWSIGHALTVPGGGTAAERVAEWARNHYLGPLVTFGEWLSYNPPKAGGKPDVSFNKLGGTAVLACHNRKPQARCRKQNHG